LICGLTGYLAGDVRLTYLAAWVLSAALLGYLLPNRAGILPAILLLFMPGVFHLLENAWIEPLLILLLAITTLLAIKRWPGIAVAALLFFASKQYAPLALPAIVCLLPGPWNLRTAARWIWPGIAVTAIITLPFLLWSPHAFFRSLTILNVGMIRADSISFAPVLSHLIRLRFSLAFTVLAALPAILLVLWKSPRTPAGFTAGVALILLCVFAFSPLAFGNYYTLAAGALTIAGASENQVTTDQLTTDGHR
jgi:hypothetical protein